MSHAPAAHLEKPADFAPPRPSNTVGLVGFVVSILGILTLGLLSPLALLISLIGLFNAPRGLAIAGSVLGLMGSMGLLGVVLLIVASSLHYSMEYNKAAFDAMHTESRSPVRLAPEDYAVPAPRDYNEMREHLEFSSEGKLEQVPIPNFDVPDVNVTPELSKLRPVDDSSFYAPSESGTRSLDTNPSKPNAP